MIYLQQMVGTALAPAAPVHVAAATPVTLPDLPPDRRRNRAAADTGLRLRGRGSGQPARPRRCERGLALPAASQLRRRSGVGNSRGPGGRCRPLRNHGVTVVGGHRRRRRRSAAASGSAGGVTAVETVGAVASFGAEVAGSSPLGPEVDGPDQGAPDTRITHPIYLRPGCSPLRTNWTFLWRQEADRTRQQFRVVIVDQDLFPWVSPR